MARAPRTFLWVAFCPCLSLACLGFPWPARRPRVCLGPKPLTFNLQTIQQPASLSKHDAPCPQICPWNPWPAALAASLEFPGCPKVVLGIPWLSPNESLESSAGVLGLHWVHQVPLGIPWLSPDLSLESLAGSLEFHGCPKVVLGIPPNLSLESLAGSLEFPG